jgi:uncharacterized protein
MKRFVPVAVVIVVLAFSCFAQNSTDDSPATQADVERYFQIAKSHDTMQKLMKTMSNSMQEMFHQQYLQHKDELPADYESKIATDLNGMFTNMPMDEILQAMVPAYQKHLTKGDIDNLIAFYSTPTGQKLLSEMPAIMADAMRGATPIILKYTETFRTKLQKETEDMIAQAKKSSDNKTPPTSN